MPRKRNAPSKAGAVKREGRRQKNAAKRTRVTAQSILDLETKVFLKLCKGLDTPVSRECAALARKGDWAGYIELGDNFDVTSTSYSIDQFRCDYFITQVMRKNPRLPLGIDKDAAALEKFLESEEMCKDTNRRMLRYRLSDAYPCEASIMERLKIKIASVLPPLTPSVVERIEQQMRFGPGSTSCVSGSDVMLSKKYDDDANHASPRLISFVRSLSAHDSGGAISYDASKLMFVPKNAKTNRSICIEPHWNVFVQLGIGSELKKVLSRLGLHPTDQQRNRSMAQTAYENRYATVDLSMASDTISYEVVRWLLPPDWFHLLMLCRTDFTVLPSGTRLKLEKFSSMGNGFTWELESLIFWACASIHTDSAIGVFGDDLVVPSDVYDQLEGTLLLLGFKVNKAKSFWQGGFRESCGTDWYFGQDVRPFYIKRDTDEIQDLRHYSIHLANGIRYVSHRFGGGVSCDYRYRLAWLYAREQAAKGGITTFTSYGYSDEGLIVNFDECAPAWRPGGFEGYVSRVFTRTPLARDSSESAGALRAALHRGYPRTPFSQINGRGVVQWDDRWWTRKCELPQTSPARKRWKTVCGPYSEETPRGHMGALQLRDVPVLDWYNLGPWI